MKNFHPKPGPGPLPQRDPGVPAATAARRARSPGPGTDFAGGDVSLGGGGGEAADAAGALGGPGQGFLPWKVWWVDGISSTHRLEKCMENVGEDV